MGERGERAGEISAPAASLLRGQHAVLLQPPEAIASDHILQAGLGLLSRLFDRGIDLAPIGRLAGRSGAAPRHKAHVAGG